MYTVSKKSETTKGDTPEEDTTKLIITITKKSVESVSAKYKLDADANLFVTDMLSGAYEAEWRDLLGGAVGGGKIFESKSSYIPLAQFDWPLVNSGTITSQAGYRIHPITGTLKYHAGTDIAMPKDTSILAAADGTVKFAGVEGVVGSNIPDGTVGTGYGRMVSITHSGGYETRYGHCTTLFVKAGQIVKKGEVIATVGMTGGATGYHLHFEIRLNGIVTDPLSYFK
jgi:murein DD-endopeptidase MepM/ murein hydrolase activator NlpD